MGSHWEERILKDDVMGPVIDSNFLSYSAITLGMLEATGWYKAVYAEAAPMNWGANAGCDFVNEKCIGPAPARASVEPRHFCTTLQSEQDWACTVDRLSFGYGAPRAQLP